ncbi:MAG: type II and III secretion system protein family protein [Planctomycetaceae bacterium]
MQAQITTSFFALVAAACLSWNPAFAQPDAAPAANDPIFDVRRKKSNLRIVEKFAKILRLDKRITTVSGFDQEVISVTKVDRSPNMIRVHAESPGVTSLVLADEDRNIFTVEAFVIGDVRHLQAYLTRLFPHSSVKAVAIGDGVLLRGWVTQPEHITEMREIAEQFYTRVIDQMKVGGVQQVQLKVRVMEVQRSKIRQFGFNFLFANQDGGFTSTPGQLTPLQSFTAPFGGPSAINVSGLADPTMIFAVLSNSDAFQGFVDALKQESLLKILAEPELITTNGRPAYMLSGGEFPLLVPQSLGTTTIEWRQFGVRLEAVPIILGRGRVRLELEPEVSERDFTNSVQVGGTTVPGLTTRRVNTQVEMRFGETFMIAGLLSTRTTALTNKIPILGDLPWIGAAFRRVRYERGETELVIMVTPELVAPMKGGQIPGGGIGLFTDDPTDRELFIDGKLEVTSYGDRCENCGVDTIFSTPGSGAPRLQGVAPIAPTTGGMHRIITTPVRELPVPPMPGAKDRIAPQARKTFPGNSRSARRSRNDRSYSSTTFGSAGRNVAREGRIRAGRQVRRSREDRLWDHPASRGRTGRFVRPASDSQDLQNSKTDRYPR